MFSPHTTTARDTRKHCRCTRQSECATRLGVCVAFCSIVPGFAAPLWCCDCGGTNAGDTHSDASLQPDLPTTKSSNATRAHPASSLSSFNRITCRGRMRLV